jgi:hypothetical protein
VRYIYNEEHTHDYKGSFKNLYDGMLNRKFFSIFLMELSRDYLYFNQSYENGDMAALRKYTSPVFHQNFESDGKLIEIPLGTVKNKFSNYEAFVAERFLDIPDTGLRRINVPKNFHNKVLFDTYLNDDLELNEVTYNNNNVPQCLLDLKSYINSRTVIQPSDLRKRVLIFNRNMTDKLLDLKFDSGIR